MKKIILCFLVLFFMIVGLISLPYVHASPPMIEGPESALIPDPEGKASAQQRTTYGVILFEEIRFVPERPGSDYSDQIPDPVIDQEPIVEEPFVEPEPVNTCGEGIKPHMITPSLIYLDGDNPIVLEFDYCGGVFVSLSRTGPISEELYTVNGNIVTIQTQWIHDWYVENPTATTFIMGYLIQNETHIIVGYLFIRRQVT